MKNKNIVDIVKDRITNYESPVEANKEWKAFVEKQKTEKWKRASLFILLALLVFASGSIGGYFYSQNDIRSNHEDKEEIVLEDADSNSSLNSMAKRGRVQDQFEKIQSDENVQQLKASKKPLELKDVKTAALKQSIEFNETATLNPSSLSKRNASSFSKNNQNQKQKTEVIDVDNEIDAGIKPIKEDNQLFSDKLISEKANLGAISEFEKLALLPSNVTEPKRELKEAMIKPADSLYPKRKLELYSSAGISQTRQRLTPKSALDDLYANQRKESEIALESYHFEIGVNVFLNKNVFVNPNVTYHKWYDQVNHQFTLDQQFKIEDVLLEKITYLPSGEVVELYGDTTVVGTRTTRNTQFNEYSTVNLGINVGTYFFNKKRFELGVIAGLNGNIYKKIKGKVIDAANPESSLVEINKEYKKRFGLGLAGGFVVNYKLNETVFIQMRPFANYYFNSITAKSSVLDSKLFRYGVSTGISIKLF